MEMVNRYIDWVESNIPFLQGFAFFGIGFGFIAMGISMASLPPQLQGGVLRGLNDMQARQAIAETNIDINRKKIDSVRDVIMNYIETKEFDDYMYKPYWKLTYENNM